MNPVWAPLIEMTTKNSNTTMNHLIRIPHIHLSLRAAAILLSSCSLVFGQESDERAVEKKERAEKGEKFDRQDREERKDARRDGGEDKFAGAKKKIEALQREGRHEEAERMRRELAADWAAASGKRPEKKDARNVAEGSGRLRHVQEAVRHLREAGLKEPAEHLESMARQMRSELSPKDEDGKRAEKRRPEREEGRRREGGADTRAQLQKLARQVEELRREVSKLQSGEGNRQ